MELVVASAEFTDGNVLSFKAFPTYQYSLRISVTFHVVSEIEGEIAYRVRKRDDVICQTHPMPFRAQEAEGQRMLTHAGSIGVAFPGEGSYLLDILFNDSVLHSLPLSVFDSSKRSDLEREIVYYLKRKGGARSIQEITRGVFNPRLLNKANMLEFSTKVYYALLRMSEVANTVPLQQGTLEDKMKASRWKLK